MDTLDSATVTGWQPAPTGLIVYRPPTIEDLNTIEALEAAGYPPDEAATLDRLKFRIQEAPNLFLVAARLHESDAGYEILGYCCGTSTTAAGELTEESMGEHKPEGTLLCVHSVCVASTERRKGVASKLLEAYLNYIQQSSPQIEQIRLICKEPLVELYKKAGFSIVGPSPVIHGKDPWIEMMLDISSDNGAEYSDWT